MQVISGTGTTVRKRLKGHGGMITATWLQLSVVGVWRIPTERGGSDSGIYLLLFVGCLSLVARPLRAHGRRHCVIFGRQHVRQHTIYGHLTAPCRFILLFRLPRSIQLRQHGRTPGLVYSLPLMRFQRRPCWRDHR